MTISQATDSGSPSVGESVSNPLAAEIGAGPITLTAVELAQHAELMFDLGATYMAMQCLELDDSMRDALRQVWKSPTWAELEQRRQPSDEPCGVRTCRSCSRCIRADAVRRGAVRS